jgi:hypothetical protein
VSETKRAIEKRQGKPPVAASTKIISAEEAERIRAVLKHPDMLNHSIGWLLAIVRQKGAPLPTKDEEDFAYAAFVGLEPRDAAETMLCQQMIAAYEMAMSMLTRCKQAEYLPQLQEYGELGVKMMSLYERLFQTLNKARKPQQVVEVRHTHRHVHLNAPGAGAVTEIEGQAHGATGPRALALATSPAMLGQDAPRDALPSPANQAQTLPATRRGIRDRRTNRSKKRQLQARAVSVNLRAVLAAHVTF